MGRAGAVSPREVSFSNLGIAALLERRFVVMIDGAIPRCSRCTDFVDLTSSLNTAVLVM